MVWVGVGVGDELESISMTGGWLGGWYVKSDNIATKALTHRFFPQGRVWQNAKANLLPIFG